MKAVLIVLRLLITPREMKALLWVLACLFLIPVLAVLAIAQAPIEAVSAALAAVNPTSHYVEVKDANGVVVAQLNASTVWPTWGQVTAEFGSQTPYQLHHTGIDIAGRKDDPITPFMAGKVTAAIENDSSGYGKHVVIDHGNNVTSVYGHMDVLEAKVGQEVKSGDILGLEGETGNATGVHLHFEIRVYGIPVNPRVFMVGDPPLTEPKP
jgi:murein DD-endopeptidase MepM/ murein hydrolase activator NlpD